MRAHWRRGLKAGAGVLAVVIVVVAIVLVKLNSGSSGKPGSDGPTGTALASLTQEITTIPSAGIPSAMLTSTLEIAWRSLWWMTMSSSISSCGRSPNAHFFPRWSA